MTATTSSQRPRFTTATRAVLAVLLALHGYAHFVGTADNLRRLDEHSTGQLLDWTITSPALLGTLAILWAALGSGFIIAAVITGLARPHARATVRALAAASLVLSLASLWATWIGVLVNLVILAATYLWRRP